MSEIRSYRDLKVWQRAMDLAQAVYMETKQMPKEEAFGLTSQIRRAAVSIPSNIAEGHARNGTKEYRHFLSIAQGSLAELETQTILGRRIDYISQESAEMLLGLCTEVSRMLAGLKKRLAEGAGNRV